MSTITVLALILLLLMIAVGGKQGWSSFVSLMLNFCYFFLGLVLAAWHFSPLVITVILGILILATTIFMGTDDIQVSVSAFEASIIVMIIVIIMTLVAEHFVQATGFSNENSSELEGMSILIGISYVQIGMMTMILSCSGSIAEASIAIVSGIVETFRHDKHISSRQLMLSGMQIGKHIMGTTLNTLLFGFLGNLLALFIWFAGLNYSFGTIMNNKILVTELVTVLISFIGVILTVPLSTELILWNQRKIVDNEHKTNYDTNDK